MTTNPPNLVQTLRTDDVRSPSTVQSVPGTVCVRVRTQLEGRKRKGEILKRKHCFKNVQYCTVQYSTCTVHPKEKRDR
jgi:hypothetical protein